MENNEKYILEYSSTKRVTKNAVDLARFRMEMQHTSVLVNTVNAYKGNKQKYSIKLPQTKDTKNTKYDMNA